MYSSPDKIYLYNSLVSINEFDCDITDINNNLLQTNIEYDYWILKYCNKNCICNVIKDEVYYCYCNYILHPYYIQLQTNINIQIETIN